MCSEVSSRATRVALGFRSSWSPSAPSSAAWTLSSITTWVGGWGQALTGLGVGSEWWVDLTPSCFLGCREGWSRQLLFCGANAHDTLPERAQFFRLVVHVGGEGRRDGSTNVW